MHELSLHDSPIILGQYSFHWYTIKTYVHHMIPLPGISTIK